MPNYLPTYLPTYGVKLIHFASIKEPRARYRRRCLCAHLSRRPMFRDGQKGRTTSRGSITRSRPELAKPQCPAALALTQLFVPASRGLTTATCARGIFARCVLYFHSRREANSPALFSWRRRKVCFLSSLLDFIGNSRHSANEYFIYLARRVRKSPLFTRLFSSIVRKYARYFIPAGVYFVYGIARNFRDARGIYFSAGWKLSCNARNCESVGRKYC